MAGAINLFELDNAIGILSIFDNSLCHVNIK